MEEEKHYNTVTNVNSSIVVVLFLGQATRLRQNLYNYFFFAWNHIKSLFDYVCSILLKDI